MNIGGAFVYDSYLGITSTYVPAQKNSFSPCYKTILNLSLQPLEDSWPKMEKTVFSTVGLLIYQGGFGSSLTGIG